MKECRSKTLGYNNKPLIGLNFTHLHAYERTQREFAIPLKGTSTRAEYEEAAIEEDKCTTRAAYLITSLQKTQRDIQSNKNICILLYLHTNTQAE